ncbi:hypothetical protein [Microlunatus soli]|uniref:O-antigen ligase like membrane protein n=1 Tax=Microlunatus soli TaxID=630515 RepID=A0A1H1WD30_9ACTN|nr:hypothetical protein [Microlunatus soli]SDS94914.1 hypothetical protein SAMN04489812_3595 [Microlunatus soli]
MGRRARDPVVWVIGLFAANFALQRISIPNLSIPVITVVILVWLAAALWLRIVELNIGRLMLWVLAAAVSAAAVLAQVLVLSNAFVSINSWLFWIVLWLPLTVQLRDRSAATYHRALRGIGHLGIGIAILSTLFMVMQLLGQPYRDRMADLVPSSLLVDGYVISYPVAYGSPIYKSNAWIALEPSFLSFMLGVCVVAAVLARLHWVKVIVILLGLLATTAGSGLAVLAAFVLLSVLSGHGARLRRYLLPTLPVAVIFGTTLIGQSLFERVTEAGTSRSSTSLRMIEPYQYLWPQWISDPTVPWIGRGPGSSAWVVGNSGIDGLLVPSPAKILFDYGVLGGALLLMIMVVAFVRCPEPTFALALAISVFTVQAASPPLVACVILAVSLWSPVAVWSPTRPSPMTAAAPQPIAAKE